MPYPNFPDKHAAAPLVTPQRFLDYARASGRLINFQAPKGVLLVYDRPLMARLVASYGAEIRRKLGCSTRCGGCLGQLARSAS